MPGSLDNLEEAIRKLQEMYDDPDIVIPASQLPEKENPYKAFEERNPMAGGGMLVQPSTDGSRPGYKEEKFISGPGTKTTALDDPKKYKIVKKYLNKVKTQKNKRIFLDWSEQIGSKPNPWYVKLSKEVKLSRQPLNLLINKVIAEEFPTAYSGREGKIQYAREMTVKSFINYWNQNGMFDGNEKLAKPLEQFVTTKKGANNYENINRYFREWKEGKFEVDGVDRKNLDKDLLQSIKKWSSSVKGKRSNLVKEQLIYLNKLNPNLSYDRVANLFAKKFPDSSQTLQHRLNQLTELKRNGAYSDGTGNPKKIPGIGIGERSGWLKEGYGKGFLGNYGRLVKKADELMAAGETRFARRLYNAADKFFSPTGIFTKAAGEGEHPLSRNMGDGPIGNQLKINSLVSGDLNQFKKFNFDSPVRNLVLEYENPNTTGARRKEIKLEIENRKKLMNILTEGPNQKGIVDSVKFNYGTNKIGASVDVPDIDKIKNFDINEFITRGEEYRTSVLQKGKDFGLVNKEGQIIKQTLGAEQIESMLAAMGCPGKAKGGRVGFNDGANYQRCILKGIKEVQTKSPNQLTPGAKANFTKITKTMQGARLMKNILGPAALAYEGLFAAPFAVYDYASGRPGEDILKNFLTLGIADQKLYENELKRKFPDYGKAQYLMDFDDRISEYERQMGGTKGQMRRAKPKLDIALDNFKNDPTRLEFAQTEDPAASLFENFLKSQEAEKAVAQEYATRKEERGFGESVPQLDLGDFSYGEMAKGGRAGYNDGKLVEPVEIDMVGYREQALQDMHKHYKYYKKMGGKMKKRQFANEFFRQYHSSGGIASGPPPEKGPNSQGLQGLLNRVKKLKE